MQKSIIASPTPQQPDTSRWLDLDTLARVEITSEDVAFPVDHAFSAEPENGWRAATTGPQVIRLIFRQPVDLHRIQLHFLERAAERSQEFALYAASQNNELREIRRQQFAFSPYGSTEEREDFQFQLPATTLLELRIDPDRAHDPRQSRHYATLQAMRLA